MSFLDVFNYNRLLCTTSKVMYVLFSILICWGILQAIPYFIINLQLQHMHIFVYDLFLLLLVILVCASIVYISNIMCRYSTFFIFLFLFFIFLFFILIYLVYPWEL